MKRAICVTNKVGDNYIFRGIVFLEEGEPPEQRVRRMTENGNHYSGVVKVDIHYFYIDPTVAEKLKDIDVSEGTHWTGPLMTKVCKAFEVEHSLEKALRALGEKEINEALDRGWEPEDALETLDTVLDMHAEGALGDMYAEDLMVKAERDVRVAVDFCALYYKRKAGVFLHELKDYGEW